MTTTPCPENSRSPHPPDSLAPRNTSLGVGLSKRADEEHFSAGHALESAAAPAPRSHLQLGLSGPSVVAMNAATRMARETMCVAAGERRRGG